MTISEIKREAKLITKENARNPVLAFFYIYLIPVLCAGSIVAALTALFSWQGTTINFSFILPIIMGYFSLWYAKYAINTIGGSSVIQGSAPSQNNFWEYFPYIGLMSILMLLNVVLNVNLANIINIIILILEVIFMPIPFVIVILNKENSGRIGLALGSKYFLRTLALQIRFIPLYFLIAITFGIVGIFKYTYIQTTFAIYALDLMKRESV
ncbi:hypothetical protein [Clostridium massiliamazoniense]|uniref:hypothetical protein n=1 Tax=Clostridium massiliamazoniense TaxID=1347366 RepID=UPI0006D7B80E|nr:hypothetical protein [Clostridium massiliamazoniense]